MNKEILKLAIPNIISNVSVPLLSSVDTALMGRMSALHIGAVGLGAMIFNFIYWNFGFLRMGTTGITAQAFGQKNELDIIQTLGRATFIALVIAGILLLFHPLILNGSIILLGIEQDQHQFVSDYFNIRIWAAPATLGTYVLIGWFFGMQNAIYPLIITVSVNLINIILSFLFVYYWDLEIRGVALGTTVAQYVGLFLGLSLFLYRYSSFWTQLRASTLLQWAKLYSFLKINSDIFIRTLLLTFAFTYFYNLSSSSGVMILAVNVILLQFVNWMSYGIDGFAFATESLVGKYAGARNRIMSDRAIKTSFIWGMGTALMFSLVYGILGITLLGVFTDRIEVIEAAKPYLIWMILFPVLSTPCYLWDGIFIGLTASKAMRNCMLIAFPIFIVATHVFQPLYQNHGLWLALLTFMVARGGIQYLYFNKFGLDIQ